MSAGLIQTNINDSFETTMKRVDEAHQAKSTGRNRIYGMET